MEFDVDWESTDGHGIESSRGAVSSVGQRVEEEASTSASEIVLQLVHVNLIKFVQVDDHGHELDAPAAIGYIVYNGECREFGEWSFRGSDDYTLEADVLTRIQSDHPRLARAIDRWGGFYLSGLWCPVRTNGAVVH